MIALTIFSRPGCHLCEEMKAVARRAASGVDEPVTIEEINISTDPYLEAKYGLEIPVLLVDGRKTAKYRVSEQELTRVLRERARGVG